MGGPAAPVGPHAPSPRYWACHRSPQSPLPGTTSCSTLRRSDGPLTFGAGGAAAPGNAWRDRHRHRGRSEPLGLGAELTGRCGGLPEERARECAPRATRSRRNATAPRAEHRAVLISDVDSSTRPGVPPQAAGLLSRLFGGAGARWPRAQGSCPSVSPRGFSSARRAPAAPSRCDDDLPARHRSSGCAPTAPARPRLIVKAPARTAERAGAARLRGRCAATELYMILGQVHDSYRSAPDPEAAADRVWIQAPGPGGLGTRTAEEPESRPGAERYRTAR